MDSQRDGQGNYTSLESNNTIVSRLVQQDKVPWYRKLNLRILYLLMFPTCIGVKVTGGFDSSMMNGLQAVASWLEYFNHPDSASLGVMVSMYPLGSFIAVPFVPSLVDKVGRRYPILLGGITSIIGGILQSTAPNLTMFILARFILGFTHSFCVVSASSLIGELSHPKERAVMGCLFNASQKLGAVFAAGVVLGTFSMAGNWGWRIPSFLQAVPGLFQVVFIWFLPESPRWLVSKGRNKEAYDILVKYHAEGDQNSEFVKAEYAQIVEAQEAELKMAWTNQKAMFSAPGMRKRVTITTFLALFTRWSGDGLISHYLSMILETIGIHDNRTKNIINLAKVSWGFITSTIAAFITPQYPRRTMYLACAISVFVVFVVWTAACAEYSSTQSKTSAQAVLALVFLYQLAHSLAYAALNYTFLVELFPFHIRARGISVYQWWSQGAAFANQFVNPIAVAAAGWRWYMTYCMWDAFQIGFIYLMFPETSGRTLEELTFLYEDDRDALRNNEHEILREHADSETYGATEGHPKRNAGGGRS